MIEGRSVLGLITARGGSKGIPRKNVRNVAGKPLLAWTIEEGLKSQYLDRLILSSDDAEIIETARQWGCDVPFVRPPELARDTTPGVEPVVHALDMIEPYDYVVLLQPTSPLRVAGDIDGCLETSVSHEASTSVSVVESDKTPYWMYFVDDIQRMSRVLGDGWVSRRQESPTVYVLNGAVYVAKTQELRRTRSFLSDDTVAYVMPKERSIDVDSEWDLWLAECALRAREVGQ